jgi:hypothetical protein
LWLNHNFWICISNCKYTFSHSEVLSINPPMFDNFSR